MNVPAELLAKVAQFIELVGTLNTKQASDRSAVRERAPNVVDRLIKAGMIEETARDQAISQFSSSHLSVLENLGKAAEVQAEAPPSMGSPHVNKQASALSGDPYARHTSPADDRFLANMGLAGAMG